ncbi:hypothetical protein EZV73_26600 [Acidaminobacter sp. JC074]|uniref:hypothetical protein n=1 Tax=Acidaminobacter sp. JC074 TaxID=2530199 RepID=UPI001F10E75A|nr:hypothetical protein [Acidaminobacter sp. JC074]MCH4891177.1 hypothetical protein [Acidaminobacter sp. JC074]
MIILSINNNEDSITLPIHPVGVGPSRTKTPIEFKTFKNGTILIDKKGELRALSIESMFPEHAGKYPFQEKNSIDAVDYVEKLNKWFDIGIPIRIKIFNKDVLTLNMPCTITEFTPLPDKVNDINYTLGLKEFPVRF